MKKIDYRIHVLSNLKKDVLNYNTNDKLVAEIEYTLEQLKKPGLIGFVYKNIGFAFAKDPIIKLILKDLNSIDRENNWTALQYAADMGYYATTESLLLNGADVTSIAFQEGLSALDLACIKGHVDIVRLLLQHKAVVTCRTLDICLDIESKITNGMRDTNQNIIPNLVRGAYAIQPRNPYPL